MEQHCTNPDVDAVVSGDGLNVTLKVGDAPANEVLAVKNVDKDDNYDQDDDNDVVEVLFETKSEEEIKNMSWYNRQKYYMFCSAKTKNQLAYLDALEHTLESRYFYAIVVYLAYCISMVFADVGKISNKEANDLYFNFGIEHLINACMFVWAWDDRGWFDDVVIPEYLNIIGAALYIWSASLYPVMYSDDDLFYYYYKPKTEEFKACRYIELVACIIFTLSAFGWIYSWYRLFTENFGPVLLNTSASRGISILDPEWHCNWTLVAASIVYLYWGIDTAYKFSHFSTDSLYMIGNILYLLNGIFYVIAAFRDYGWFFQLPDWTISDYISYYIFKSKDVLNAVYHDDHDNFIPKRDRRFTLIKSISVINAKRKRTRRSVFGIYSMEIIERSKTTNDEVGNIDL